MKKSNTKKNKMCFSIPDELEPFNLLHSFMIFNLVEGIADTTDSIIEGVATI